MLIREIYSTQRCLRRKEQIEGMVNVIQEHGYIINPIILFKCSDGKCHVVDGHHRLTAYFASGKEVLDGNEYVLLEGEICRKPRIMKMSEFFKQHGFVV